MDRVDAQPPHAAHQQGGGRSLRAGFDLQDGGGAGRAGRRTLSPTDRIHCPGFLDLGNARFHCWSKRGHGSLDLHGGLKHSCDVFFYEAARRTGIDRVAAMARRLGMGTALAIDLPGAKTGLIPTREWSASKGRRWNPGDTVVSGIGQGYIQVTPLQLATYASRVATGRAVVPHLLRARGGVLEPGARPEAGPALACRSPCCKSCVPACSRW